MKKRLGVLVLAIVMVFSLVACGSPFSSSSNNDIIEGSWALTKGQVGDKEVSLETLQSAGIGGTTFTFTEGVVRITMTASAEVSEGSYTLKGNEVTISSEEEGVSYTGTVEGDTLTIVDSEAGSDEEQVQLIFERQK